MTLPPYRILVTGWRFWPRPAAYVVRSTLAMVAAPALLAGQAVVVIEGKCPRGGVDDYAFEWAMSHVDSNVHSIRMPAQWDLFGKAAGSRRNQDMVDRGADICLGFPGPPIRKTSGTTDCMTRASAAGIAVVPVPWAEWFTTDLERFKPRTYLNALSPMLGW